MRVSRTLLLAAAGLMVFAPEANAKVAGKKEGVKKARIKAAIPKRTVRYVERTPPHRQVVARKIFKRANKEFEQRRVDEAIRLYRETYKIWPHPRVEFNIAVSLGMQGLPLQSATMFKKVLGYRKGPITPERYKQALERYTELMGQLAVLEVTCTDVGAKIFVNGKRIGVAPLRKLVTLGPGTALITATLQGKVPYNAQVRLEGGTRSKVAVKMRAFTDVVQYKMVDRYHWGVPAGVTGAAAAILGVGLGLLFKGRADIDDLQVEVDDAIRQRPSQDSTFNYNSAKEDRAKTFQISGFAMLGVATAATVAAVVLWLVRKKRVRYTPESDKPKKLEIRF